MRFGFSHRYKMPLGTTLNSLLSVRSNRTVNLLILELHILLAPTNGQGYCSFDCAWGKKNELVKQLRSTYRVKRNSHASSSCETLSSTPSQNTMVFMPFAAMASKHIPTSLTPFTLLSPHTAQTTGWLRPLKPQFHLITYFLHSQNKIVLQQLKLSCYSAVGIQTQQTASQGFQLNSKDWDLQFSFGDN